MSFIDFIAHDYILSHFRHFSSIIRFELSTASVSYRQLAKVIGHMNFYHK